jgi:hypothetical protein
MRGSARSLTAREVSILMDIAGAVFQRKPYPLIAIGARGKDLALT